jgi:hypothetical protein
MRGKQRVRADTLHRVAATLLVRSRVHGRRATAVAAVLTACLHRELALAADALGLLTGSLLLMLVPGPWEIHLASIVVVEVGVAVLLTLVAGVIAGVSVPPRAWR